MKRTTPIFFMFSVLFSGFLFTFAAQGAVAPDSPACEIMSEGKRSFTVCTVDLAIHDTRLYWKKPDGEPFSSFPALQTQLAKSRETLIFATNISMFHSDYSPVGLFVEKGEVLNEISTKDAEGNFFLKPNGVFWFTGKAASITETNLFIKENIKPHYASQSGPILVDGGMIPAHLEGRTTSERRRNGVGLKANGDGKMIFVVSDTPVTFAEFAKFFKERLGCTQAIHLDTSSSSLFAPSLGRSDRWLPIGPILAVVKSTVKPTTSFSHKKTSRTPKKESSSDSSTKSPSKSSKD